MTGGRARPIDRRRLQGEHRDLKELLTEGAEADEHHRPWRDFSRAMSRQSVGEAMRRLSARERVVIAMAYFAGFSNDEIAEELGMTGRGVRRSLRRALDRLSAALEGGRQMVLSIFLGLSSGRLGRWLSDTATPATTHAVAVVAVVAAVAAAPVISASTAGTGSQSSSGQSSPVQSANAAPSALPVPTPTGVTAPGVTVPGLNVPISIPPLPAVKPPRVNLP